jgi:hypothetical protein
MAVKSGIFGTDLLLKNLNREIIAIEGRTDAGLNSAALWIKGESQKITPIKIGNLRDSAYTDRLKHLAYVIGYTAYYAPFVHEINKNYKAPGTSWKFLEKTLQRTRKILQIIANKAKIK